MVASELFKVALSVTEDGHKLDARVYRAEAKSLKEISDAMSDYRRTSPIKNGLFGSGIIGPELVMAIANKRAHSSMVHADGKNDFNPFKGYGPESMKELEKLDKKKLEKKKAE